MLQKSQTYFFSRELKTNISPKSGIYVDKWQVSFLATVEIIRSIKLDNRKKKNSPGELPKKLIKTSINIGVQ